MKIRLAVLAGVALAIGVGPARAEKPLGDYVRTSHRLGFSTMPILFNGNNLKPDTLGPAFRPRGDAYVKAVVDAIKDEPGLLAWDTRTARSGTRPSLRP